MTTLELIDTLQLLDPEGTLEVAVGPRAKPIGVLSRENVNDAISNEKRLVIWIKWSGI